MASAAAVAWGGAEAALPMSASAARRSPTACSSPAAVAERGLVLSEVPAVARLVYPAAVAVVASPAAGERRPPEGRLEGMRPPAISASGETLAVLAVAAAAVGTGVVAARAVLSPAPAAA